MYFADATLSAVAQILMGTMTMLWRQDCGGLAFFCYIAISVLS